MKVPVFVDRQKLEFQERPKPKIKSKEVLMRVEYCGICGSDLHGYETGTLLPKGIVLGHECCGTVAEVGDEIKNFQPGDRVVVKPIPHCGECYYCKRGEFSLCVRARPYNLGFSPNHDGAFAEYVNIYFPDSMLYKLPSNVSFKEAALVEPLATSLHAVRLSRFRLGNRVVVIGAGMIGLGIIQFLKLGGAGKIILIQRSPEKAEIARKLGVDVVLTSLSGGEKLREEILSLTDGIGADIVFECAGVPFSLQTSINYVKSGGQVMVVGVNVQEVPINPLMFQPREVEMKGVMCYYDEFNYVLELLSQKKIDAELFISDIIPLAEIEEKGFRRLLASKNIVKILVKP